MLLITGATGFIGKNLTPLLARDNPVRILARRTSNLKHFLRNKNIEIVYGDLDSGHGLDQALTDVDIVIHSAARTIGSNFLQYYATNTLGTEKLVTAMKKLDVQKIIFLSSHTASGPCATSDPVRESAPALPVSFYGRSKRYAENFIARSGLSYIILRPVAVYGPHDYDVLRYIKLIDHGLCPIVGFKEKYVNFIYVMDLACLIKDVIQQNTFTNRTFFVNDGVPYTYEEVILLLAELLDKKVHTFRVPYPLALLYGLANDVFLPAPRRLVWRDKIHELAQQYWLCSNAACCETFAFKPRYGLRQGMQETIAWYRKQNLL